MAGSLGPRPSRTRRRGAAVDDGKSSLAAPWSEVVSGREVDVDKSAVCPLSLPCFLLPANRKNDSLLTNGRFDRTMAAAAATMDMTTPPFSATSTPSSFSAKRGHSPNMSLDLSDLPALSQPSPPSNTLLITNLNAPEIFTSANLESISQAINEHATIHTFAPLKSFRRIICTFYSAEDAVKIRQVLDGESVLGERIRVYFGAETKIEQGDQHLQAPKSDKLFFISPPPSPPMGWEMRDEEPPNKEVHAEDLATALSRLQARPSADEAMLPEVDTSVPPTTRPGRQRSGTGTVVYDPEEQGHSPHLPAIAVEDTSETESPGDMSPMEGVEKKFVHTSRPPVELMEQ